MPYTPQMVTSLLLTTKPYDQYWVPTCDTDGKQGGNMEGFHMNLCHHPLLTIILPLIHTHCYHTFETCDSPDVAVTCHILGLPVR